MPNTNCLKGMACPKCNSEGPFGIEITLVVEFSDDGSDPFPEGDSEWDDESYCECRSCSFSGTVGDFTPGGAEARR